ncbi:MAG: phosphatase PAP2 family protein, partial [Verrucomicrobiota bacterium]|nr:phosphatase PAP2 family protein [Verrucomicrobiota bacterium]
AKDMAAERTHALGAKTLAWVSTALLVAIVASIAVVDRPLALLIENQLGGATRMAGGITTALEWIFAFDLSKYLYAFVLLLIGLVLHVVQKGAARARYFYFIGTTLLLSRVISGTLKNVFERVRPFEWIKSRAPADFFVDGGSAFPSGHAAFYFGLFLPLAILFPRFKWVFLAFAFIAALARVFEQDHFLSDILASALVAALLTFGLAKAFRIQPLATLQTSIRENSV